MHRFPSSAAQDTGRWSGHRLVDFAAVVVVFGLMLAGCAPGEAPPAPPPPEDAGAPEPRGEPPEDDPAADASEELVADTHPGHRFPLPLVEFPVAPPQTWDLEPGERAEWAEATLEAMTLRQKVGQMMMPWVMGDFAPEGTPSHDRIARLIDEHEIGGIIMSVGMPTEVAAKLNVLQQRSPLPLLVAADLETGAGFRLRGALQTPGAQDLGGATDFPPLMALGATGQRALAYEMGRITALEARAVGIHVPFAPVLDVNNNPENPIINTRSFGEDPEVVGGFGRCFVRGVQDHGAIATGKHFPGHGDTGVDSHLALPVIELGRARLDQLELVPFREAIDAGMGSVMTAHIALPGVAESPRLPATLSRRVLTNLLRDELGFDGLVFTDAMDMNAIDRLYSRGEAAARAVEAGADIILMPPDVGAAIRGIVDAVRSGRIPEERIDRSVLRILRAKEEAGLHERRTVDLEAIHRKVGIRPHTDVAREIAERSLTLLRNQGSILPLAGTRTADVLSVSYRRQNDLFAGRFFDAQLRSTYPRLRSEAVIRGDGPEVYERLLREARSSNLVVVSTYVAASAYAGSVAVSDELSDFVRDLARHGVPHVVVSFGNPYLLEELRDARAFLLAWGGAEASQRAAARALVGQVPVQGRTPTRIPPTVAIGDGIQLGTPSPAVAARLNPDPAGC